MGDCFKKWKNFFSKEQFVQQAASDFWNEELLQRVTGEFFEQATSATSNKQILQRVTNDFTTSNEKRMNSNEWQATSEKLPSILFKRNFDKKMKISETGKEDFLWSLSNIERSCSLSQ